MYEVVLMMAIGQGAAAPAWQGNDGPPVKTYGDHGQREYRHRRWGCHGGGGCSGSGYGYGGCSGSGYRYGGGCYGSGYGYGGCSGSGYGCYGSGGYASGSGCWGSGYSPYNMYPMPATQPGSGRMQPPKSGTPNVPAPKPAAPGSGSASLGVEPATFVVTLPADATLTVDGTPTRSTSSTRTFQTPPLPTGEEFFYDLNASLNRDGKAVTAKQRISVRAGQESRVRLEFPQVSGAGG